MEAKCWWRFADICNGNTAGVRLAHLDSPSLLKVKLNSWILQLQDDAVQKAHVSATALPEGGKHFKAHWWVWEHGVHTQIRHRRESACEVDDGGAGHSADVGSSSTCRRGDTKSSQESKEKFKFTSWKAICTSSYFYFCMHGRLFWAEKLKKLL